MQKIGQIWLGFFSFLKWGPVQTAQGPPGTGPGGSLSLIAASIGTWSPRMGPGSRNGTRKVANWDRN
jgi:hypothetical protein